MEEFSIWYETIIIHIIYPKGNYAKKKKKGIKQVNLTSARGKVKVHVPLELNLHMDLLPTPLTSFIYLQLEFTVSTFDDNGLLAIQTLARDSHTQQWTDTDWKLWISCTGQQLFQKGPVLCSCMVLKKGKKSFNT